MSVQRPTRGCRSCKGVALRAPAAVFARNVLRALLIVPTLLAVVTPAMIAAQPAAPSAQVGNVEALAPRINAIFTDWARTQHVPGAAWGVVKDGRLIHVGTFGTQDQDSKRPVTADTRFRIASMSKAFTALAILKLRDAGKLSLDAPAENYVPELAGWRYPTTDSPKITVRDLLHHNAGFVEDNPWGDRQQPLSERNFSAMLRAGVPFANAPGLTVEYSNLGYALLGRIITNISGSPYQAYIRRELFAPLGMTATGHDIAASPPGSRAIGYRWQDEAYFREPDMADGAFGAMGGVQTTVNDYWRWIAFLLSGWPARDGPDAGPVRRSTVREIVEGANFAVARERPVALGTPCRIAISYAMGWNVVDDCDLGRIVTHGGGYPGYGSNVAMLPDAGVGVFVFSNRTYTGGAQAAFRALRMLREAGWATPRPTPVSPGLLAAYAAAQAAWRAGDPAAAPLAVNVPLDRDLARRKTDLIELKAKVGECATPAAALQPISAMEGTFTWTCARGRVAGRVQRAPTPQLSLQVLDLRPVE